MHRLLIAIVAAVALGGCAILDNSPLADLTPEECAALRAEADFWRQALTEMAPDAVERPQAQAAISLIQARIDLRCPVPAPAAEGIAIETSNPSTTGESNDAQ